MKFMRKSWIVSALATAFVGCFSLGAINVFAQPNATLSGVNFEDTYAKGTMLTIPEGTLTIGGEEKTAQAEIVFPDGGRYALSTVNLSQVGNYKVNYSCRVGGKKYTESVDFSVYNSLYQVNNSILAKAEYHNEYQLYEEFDGSTSKLEGLYVDLPSGAEFQFNQIIDLSSVNKLDSIVDFIILPTEQGSHDFDTLYFQLTDIYDSDNYIRVSYQKRSANTLYGLQSAYAKAGAAFQPFVGYEATLDKIHTNNIYGCPTTTSFCGVPKITTSEDPSAAALKKDSFTSISLDYSTKEVYTSSFGSMSMVVDLDNARFFTDKWEGFTTGEAYLSIYAGNYVGANSAKLFISNVNGFDLTNNKLVDTTKPNMSVDFEGVDSNNLPNAIVGCTYPIFQASALDSVDGEIEVKTSVYYNYQSTNRSLCNIIDGRVRVKRSGLYTIIYEATDGSGNSTRKEYTFKAKTATQALTAEIGAGVVTTAQVGTRVNLHTVDVLNYVQTYNTDVEVTFAGQKVDVENNSFVPNKVGAYKVVYSVEDFVGQKATASYTLNVQDTGAPVFYEEPVFPKYLISGKTYNFPMLSAYDYATDANGKAIVAKKYLTDKNNRAEVVGNTFTPVVNNSGDNVLVEYVAKNAQNRQTVISKSIPCYIVTKDGGAGLDTTKYFIKNGNVSITPSSGSMLFETNQNKAGFTFLNSLLADELSILLKVDKSKNKFERLNVYLTDYANEDIKIKVSFIKAGSVAAVFINDSADRFALESSFSNEMLMPITFNAYVNTITTEHNNSLILPVTTTLSGAKFTGFPSGRAYLNVEFEGVTGNAGIVVSKISEQTIGSSEKDSGKPNVGVLGVYPVQYALNSVVTLYDALAIDVLDPNVTFTMSVRDSSNKYMKDVNTGLELKNVPVSAYTIKLDKYGEYKINYVATDTAGKKTTVPITVVVFDDQAPVITLENTLPTSMKKNKSITIPEATATDNLDKEVNVFIYVEDPAGAVSMLVGSVSQNYTFKPTMSGLYVIKYLATDNAGNVTIVNCEVWVS